MRVAMDTCSRSYRGTVKVYVKLDHIIKTKPRQHAGFTVILLYLPKNHLHLQIAHLTVLNIHLHSQVPRSSNVGKPVYVQHSSIPP